MSGLAPNFGLIPAPQRTGPAANDSTHQVLTGAVPVRGTRPEGHGIPGPFRSLEDQMPKLARLDQRSERRSAPLKAGAQPSRAAAEDAVRTLIRWPAMIPIAKP
jgi:hypothetical protein